MAKRDITFDLINGNVVDRLSREGRIELPHRQLDIPKDERWNEKQMSSKILQGILNGDSIPTIARSMEEVVGRNEVSAMRNARTMVTSAQNQGRLDSFNNLAAQGVVMKKEWEATPDDRTRKSHIDIDGEEQDLDKPFSNKCMFPGDGNGPGEEVWNCRCAMGSHIIGFRRRDGSISRVNYTPDRTSHEDMMEKYKERLRSETIHYTDLSDKNYKDTANWFIDNSNLDEWQENIFDLEYDEEIWAYTGDYYSSVNSYLRTGDMPKGVSEDKVESIIKELDESINTFELNSPITVYRASGTNIFGDNNLSYNDLKAKIGDTVHDDAYLSTSTLKELPGEQTVGGKIKYDINIDSGEGQGAYIAKYSENHQEQEFLIARDRDYLIEDVFKDEDDIVHVVMRLL